MKKPVRKKALLKTTEIAVTSTLGTSDRQTRGRNRNNTSFPVAPLLSEMPVGYAALLGKIKRRIQEERLRTVMAANSAMVLMYWDIGRLILDRQEKEGWGARVIYRLSADLREAYPEMDGLSSRNLLFMRSFALAYPDIQIVKQLVSQLPWGHVIRLLQRIKDTDIRHWYAKASIAHGWSRSILEIQIDTRAHERQGKAVTNFETTLPPTESDMAAQIFA
jgi:predicted nuclease of restriction endonuclease-like (RecB) superfamily